MKITLDEAKAIQSTINDKIQVLRRDIQGGAYKVVNSSVHIANSGVEVRKVPNEDFSEKLAEYNTLIERSLDIAEIIQVANKKVVIKDVLMFTTGERKNLSIAKAIHYLKTLQSNLHIYRVLGDKNPTEIEMTGNSNERQIKTYEHDIEWFKLKYEEFDDYSKALSMQVQKAVRDSKVEVPFAEDYL